MDSAEEIEVLSCTVSGVIYKNDENGYAILKVQDEDGADRTITGTIPYAWPGETLTAYGHWVNRAGHGRQFEVESTVREEPEGSRAAFLYLSSGAVKGIGPALAGQIVTKFGDRALFVIEEEPERLAEIKGIGSGRAKTISEEYCRQVNLKKLVLLLNESGVLPEYAIRFYRFFGDRSINMLKENPYLLTMDGVQAPFAAADRLAEELGITDSDPNRIRAGIRFVLQHNEKNGHCFIPYGKLLPAAAKQLGIDPEEIGTVIEDMTAEQSLIREAIAGEDACYLPDMYRAECTAASHLARLAGQPQRTLPNLEELVDACEREQGIHYAEQQREILRAAASHAVLAVTGGPGTGKTTSLRGVLKLYGRMGLRTLLAAPTGRAAKHMSELTGAEAATIHRLLGAKLSETGMEVVFSRNRDNPLSCDAVIVDECSMVDIRLMASLLEALPKKVRLVLVGDAAQLPSVGPGNVFSAILRSGVVPTVRLTAIFRQQEGSRIVRNAHMINKGEHPDLSENTGDFFRLRRLQAASVQETVVDLFKTRLPEKMNIPPEEIQVLSPTRKGECGTVELNRLLQEALNPPGPEKAEKLSGSTVLRVGDRLIQTRNDYDVLWEDADGQSGVGIYNGEIGTLTAIDADAKTLTVDFDGRRATYDFESLTDLEHAWALTVHKAQGCEYRAVILALADASRRLMTRTVLYTAVTRARELLILVGNEASAFQMIDNEAPTRRYNALRIRLLEACGG